MERLVLLNVGLPGEAPSKGMTVRTAMWKFPVEGRRVVRILNSEGDAQADLASNGGEQRAVFVYQVNSYSYWEHFAARHDFTFGQFGENFTSEGLAFDRPNCRRRQFSVVRTLAQVTRDGRCGENPTVVVIRHKSV